jgi:hypothetical protein
MLNKLGYYQQGDVLMVKTETPSGERAKNPKGLILAEGETTGHYHELCGEADTYIVDGIVYVDVKQESVLTHQEHKHITIPVGTYSVGIVREYDYDLEEARKVRD